MKGKAYIVWARVSSVSQKDEGWSLPHQQERLREYAKQQGGTVLREYVVTETASKSQERETFREMLAFARSQAGKLDGILVMKIDRAARNLRDYVELERLEEQHGIKLISVTQPTESTPAGRMMRRTLANMAAFYTEQLAIDVKNGIRKRIEAGLFWHPPYGYANARDGKRRVIAVDQVKAQRVRRIFTLYAFHNHTLESLIAALLVEGTCYNDTRARWSRSKLHELLRDRSYIGEVYAKGNWHPGTHEPLIDRPLFDRVQALLGNRIQRSHQMLYASKTITCGHCGRPISGENKTKGGRQYIYYRCTRYNAPGHPRVRVPEKRLDEQMVETFAAMQIDEEFRGLIRAVLKAQAQAEQQDDRQRHAQLSEQLTKVRNQKGELLNLRLSGEIDQPTYAAKHTELRDREAMLTVELEAMGRDQSENADIAVAAFELSQSLPEKWVAADYDVKRRILEIVCLNLTLDGATLVVEMRKPFDVLAEGLLVVASAQGRTPIEHVERFIAGASALPAHIRKSIELIAGTDLRRHRQGRQPGALGLTSLNVDDAPQSPVGEAGLPPYRERQARPS